jgi:hypothetical protein
MFTSKKQLIKKTGKDGVGRFSYLEQLINEYKETKSRDAKEQVLANLANFAYDPINYEYLWRLKVLDVFFSALEERNRKLVSFAIGGICNICLDPLSREYILRNNGVKIISSLLTASEESIVLNAITTLIYIDTPNSRQEITSQENINRMLELSKNTNRRIKNLADIFLEDLCNIHVPEEPVDKVGIAATVSSNRKKLSTSKDTDYTNVGASTSGAAASTSTSTSTSVEVNEPTAGPSGYIGITEEPTASTSSAQF